MMFDKRNQKVLRYIFAVLSVLIIISMVLFFAPGITAF
jgi:preprotein translocase subunit SecE